MRLSGHFALLLLSLAGCDHSPRIPPDAKSPLTREELRTIDGEIAATGLDRQIDSEQRLVFYGPLSVAQRVAIINLIALRGQFFGYISDYERAQALAEQLVQDEPKDGHAYFARAITRATFHRFAETLADLETAEHLAFHSEHVDALRAAIFQALGRYDEALAIRQKLAAARPTITSLAAEASVQADRGEIDTAERLFIAAQYQYRDASPFPVVSLYFQQGQMWKRQGNLARARELLAAAIERLPQYAAARGQLAAVEAVSGDSTQAIEVLRPLALIADDPDYAAQLARILGEAGQVEEARAWRTAAAERYATLLGRYPGAFADHAVEFYLAAGADPQKALSLAQRNLEVRKTPRAYELVLQAALAADDKAEACGAARDARAIAHPWPSLETLRSRALATCRADSIGQVPSPYHVDKTVRPQVH